MGLRALALAAALVLPAGGCSSPRNHVDVAAATIPPGGIVTTRMSLPGEYGWTLSVSSTGGDVEVRAGRQEDVDRPGQGPVVVPSGAKKILTGEGFHGEVVLEISNPGSAAVVVDYALDLARR